MISLVNFAAVLVALALLPSATARLTRLVTVDVITIGFRSWINRKFDQDSFVAKVVECYWCSGVWVSAVTSTFAWTVVALLQVWPLWVSVPLWLLTIPAVAYEASRKIDQEG